MVGPASMWSIHFIQFKGERVVMMVDASPNMEENYT